MTSQGCNEFNVFNNIGQGSAMLLNSLRSSDATKWQRTGSTLTQVMACCLTAPSHYLNQYSGVRQNDWETRPPPGNYSTASDTWIQVSTNKMPAPDYACWRSNNSHCGVIVRRLWLWWSWRPHNLRFRKAQCISSLAAWCGRPKIGP